MRSVLLVKTSSLGDVIHNLPVVSDLLRHYPDLRIDWVVEENFAEIPRLHPGVGTVLPVAIRRWRKTPGSSATWREIAAFRRQLQATRYDLVIDTQGLLKSALITRLARGLRCGHAADSAREPHAAWFYQRKFSIPTRLHAVERNRQLVAAAADYAPDLPLQYGIHASAATDDSCVLLTATSRDDKLWPEAHWQALGRELAGRGLRCVLPAGSERERERATRIASDIPGAQVLPPSSLTSLAGVLGAARGIVGVDTGLTHLAAALDRPVVALYVATDPGLTGVHAGAQAVNLGGKGQLPTPADVLARLATLGAIQP